MNCTYCHKPSDLFYAGSVVFDILGTLVVPNHVVKHAICPYCFDNNKSSILCIENGCTEHINCHEGWCWMHEHEHKTPVCELCKQRPFQKSACLYVSCPAGKNKEYIDLLEKLNRLKSREYQINAKYKDKFKVVLDAVHKMCFNAAFTYHAPKETETGELSNIIFVLETLEEDFDKFEKAMEGFGIKYEKAAVWHNLQYIGFDKPNKYPQPIITER